MTATWDTLEMLGFHDEEQPDGNMHYLPEDVTSLSEKALMALFSSYTQWTCYAASRLTDARGALREAAGHLGFLAAVAQSQATEKTVAARKATAAADPTVKEAEQVRTEHEAMVEALEMVHENARLRCTFLSRELSRRIASRDTDQRGARWSA